jgi:hypothetical protein
MAHSIVGGSAWEPTPWRAGAAGGAGDAEEDVVTWVVLYSTLFILLDDYDLRAGGVR